MTVHRFVGRGFTAPPIAPVARRAEAAPYEILSRTGQTGDQS
jgi:hypothetical protein